MSAEMLFFVLCSLALVPLTWILPHERAFDVVGVATLSALAAVSWASALWLVSACALAYAGMLVGDRWNRRSGVFVLISAALVTFFALSRTTLPLLWIGGAYFTLRTIHVLADWWMGRLERPDLRSFLRYQFFLPALAAGPIHRFQSFERNRQRRRWEPAAFFSGAERALFGAAQAVLLGGWLMGHAERRVDLLSAEWSPFLSAWLLSALEWIQLYFTFAGWTSVAIGLALMMGIRLEENFLRPWTARNLIEFWRRWHVTLSNWCRDYVFQPVTALTRRPVIGLIAAMIAIGLWHDFSVYYLLWGLWQVLGMVLARIIAKGFPLRENTWHLKLSWLTGPLLVLAWLSLARPVITLLLGVSP